VNYGAGATPAAGTHTDSSFVTVTYAPGGLKVVTVTGPSADLSGEVEFSV